MKKTGISLCLIILFLFSLKTAYSQSNPCIKKGKSLIDIYYGFPNFYPTIIEQGYNNNFDLTKGMKPNYDVSNLGPFGVKYEYLLTDELGVGLNFFYANTTLKWTDLIYNYKSSVSRLRVVITGNYHFGTTDKFDPYFTGHIGYANFDYQFEQNSVYDSIPGVHPKPDIKFMFPLALRIGVGARYFFTEKLGINAEVGIGGIFLTGGLTYKF